MAFVYVSVWNGRKIRSPFLSITSSTATCAKVHIQPGIRLPKSYHDGSPDNHWVLKPNNSIQWYGTVLDWLDAHTR